MNDDDHDNQHHHPSSALPVDAAIVMRVSNEPFRRATNHILHRTLGWEVKVKKIVNRADGFVFVDGVRFRTIH